MLSARGERHVCAQRAHHREARRSFVFRPCAANLTTAKATKTASGTLGGRRAVVCFTTTKLDNRNRVPCENAHVKFRLRRNFIAVVGAAKLCM